MKINEVDLKSININADMPEKELERQKYFLAKCKEWAEKEKNRLGRNMTFAIQTYGCQMNAHDSEKIKGMFNTIGLDEVSEDVESDIVIFNTCCIRENAENKVYGNLGYLKHKKTVEGKAIKIILCGCMMQEEEVLATIKKKYKCVDIVFGTFNLYKLPELLQTNIETGKTVIDIWKEQQEIIEDLPSIREKKYMSSVNIMYGCNNFCTYCIVPYVRGRERSREPEDILNEVRKLVKDGVKEIMLLGQNVNSYGKNLDDPISFAKLLRKINEIEGLERIRFMTSHPKDLSDELIEAMRDCSKVCRHIHLPMQSGSSKILEKMNRRYTKEKYLDLVDRIKTAMPDIAITTDIIVGFPGETDEDIQDTIEVVERVKFNGAFTFIYSKRTGTPAAQMENGSTSEVIQERFNKVLKAVNDNIYIKSSEQVGQVYEVLLEEENKMEKGVLSGRTDNNSLIHVKADSSLLGQIVKVKVVDCKTFYLMGELFER